MATTIQLQREDRRKSLTVTITVHALLLLLALIPFIVPKPPNLYDKAIVITFEEPSSSSSSSSSSASSSEGSRPKVAMARINPTTTPRSVDVPQSKPVITSPEPELTVPPAQDNYFDQPLEVTEAVETDAIQEISDVSNPTDAKSDFDDFAIADKEERTGEPSPLEGGPGGTGDGESDGSGFFDGDFSGKAESGDDPFADGFFSGDWPGGDGTEGKNIGVGDLGDGNYWGDFAGDGLFNRKVIRRADVGKLAKREGKLVVNLCVDRSGKVVFAEVDTDKTTIRDANLQKLAEECAKGYLFDKDPGAPEQQCGRLSFLFKID